jgi:hypothetical protein
MCRARWMHVCSPCLHFTGSIQATCPVCTCDNVIWTMMHMAHHLLWQCAQQLVVHMCCVLYTDSHSHAHMLVR